MDGTYLAPAPPLSPCFTPRDPRQQGRPLICFSSTFTSRTAQPSASVHPSLTSLLLLASHSRLTFLDRPYLYPLQRTLIQYSTLGSGRPPDGAVHDCLAMLLRDPPKDTQAARSVLNCEPDIYPEALLTIHVAHVHDQRLVGGVRNSRRNGRRSWLTP